VQYLLHISGQEMSLSDEAIDNWRARIHELIESLYRFQAAPAEELARLGKKYQEVVGGEHEPHSDGG
jgi:hypothetical protein